MGEIDATWHAVRKGEILYTDGIFRTEKYRYSGGVTGID